MTKKPIDEQGREKRLREVLAKAADEAREREQKRKSNVGEPRPDKVANRPVTKKKGENGDDLFDNIPV